MRERNERIENEENERNMRIKESQRKERSYDLLRLCKSMIEEEGVKWKVSKERRDYERRNKEERQERSEIRGEEEKKR